MGAGRDSTRHRARGLHSKGNSGNAGRRPFRPSRRETVKVEETGAYLVQRRTPFSRCAFAGPCRRPVARRLLRFGRKHPHDRPRHIREGSPSHQRHRQQLPDRIPGRRKTDLPALGHEGLRARNHQPGYGGSAPRFPEEPESRKHLLLGQRHHGRQHQRPLQRPLLPDLRRSVGVRNRRVQTGRNRSRKRLARNHDQHLQHGGSAQRRRLGLQPVSPAADDQPLHLSGRTAEIAPAGRRLPATGDRPDQQRLLRASRVSRDDPTSTRRRANTRPRRRSRGPASPKLATSSSTER